LKNNPKCFKLFHLTEFWHRKIAESCYFFFRSSAPFLGSDFRDVIEEYFGPLPDMHNPGGKYF